MAEKRKRVATRLPATLVAKLDAYVEAHPWLDRSTVVGEAVAGFLLGDERNRRAILWQAVARLMRDGSPAYICTPCWGSRHAACTGHIGDAPSSPKCGCKPQHSQEPPIGGQP